MRKVAKNLAVVIVLVLVTSCMLCACGSSKSLEGKWTQSVNGVEIISFEFNDGKMTVSNAGIVSLEADYEVDGDVLKYTVGGIENESAFKIEGNKLTITYLMVEYTLEKA